MRLSLLHWSIVLFVLCLLAPTAFAGERSRSAASQQPRKKQTTRKAPTKKRLVRISGGAVPPGTAARSRGPASIVAATATPRIGCARGRRTGTTR